MKEFFPFFVQGLLLGMDEFFCHRRRVLRKWERWGHPFDTFFFSLCLAWLLLRMPSPTTLNVYVGLALWSCLFVSKDEWQHQELCCGVENWLHALLFMLHPVLLIWAGWLWWQGDLVFRPVVGTALTFTTLFGFYQALFWNVWRHDRQ